LIRALVFFAILSGEMAALVLTINPFLRDRCTPGDASLVGLRAFGAHGPS
jgi:hypothetical protein